MEHVGWGVDPGDLLVVYGSPAVLDSRGGFSLEEDAELEAVPASRRLRVVVVVEAAILPDSGRGTPLILLVPWPLVDEESLAINESLVMLVVAVEARGFVEDEPSVVKDATPSVTPSRHSSVAEPDIPIHTQQHQHQSTKEKTAWLCKCKTDVDYFDHTHSLHCQHHTGPRLYQHLFVQNGVPDQLRCCRQGRWR